MSGNNDHEFTLVVESKFESRCTSLIILHQLFNGQLF